MSRSAPRAVRRLRTILVAALVLGPLALSSPAAGQVAAGGDDAVSVLLSAARAEYSRDFFCLDPLGWLTTFRLTAERGAFGVTAAYVGAYPWPIPPPPFLQSAFIDRGPAVQLGAEVDPLRLLGGEGTADLNRFLTPFVGAGLQISTDGEEALAGVNGPEPTVAILGGTDPFVSYGARVSVPLGEGRLGIFGEVRGTSVFDGGKDFVDLQGARVQSESATLTWAEFSLGIRLNLR